TPVPPDGDEDVHDHRVPTLEHGVVGTVVRIGAVGPEADQLALIGPVGTVVLEELLHQAGQLVLRGAGVDGPDGGRHHLVIDLGGPAHGVDLGGVLAHPGVVHRGGPQHRHNVAAAAQDADE